MAAAAEAIYIGIDTSDWMVGEGSDNFDAQCDAIEFYCETKFDANPDSVVGLFTMSSAYKRLLLFPPTGDLGQILAKLQDINPGSGHLDVIGPLASSVPFLGLCRPGLNKRILLFAGGPTNLYPTVVDNIAESFKDSSIALDVVNFYLEKRCKFTANGYHFGRSALDALVAATDVDGNSHIVHVEPKSSIKDVLSKFILKKTLKNIAKENVNVKALLEPTCKGKNHAAADDDYGKHVTLSNKFE